MSYERGYNAIVNTVIAQGHKRPSRAGLTRSVFGVVFEIGALKYGEFPLLTQRRIFYKGIFGELAAFVRGATTVAEFVNWGCKYWLPNAEAWAPNKGLPSHEMRVGQVYGAQWINWEKSGYNQIEALIYNLKNDPYGRRHVLTTYSPIAVSCLPPCHLLAQFYVDGSGHLDCQVYMRSVDLILGLPSDVALYAALQVAVAHEIGLKPGMLNFMMGDAHVYEQHVDAYLTQQQPNNQHPLPTFEYTGSTVQAFEPNQLIINDYQYAGVVKYDLNV